MDEPTAIALACIVVGVLLFLHGWHSQAADAEAKCLWGLFLTLMGIVLLPLTFIFW
jgi:hypothetical protein